MGRRSTRSTLITPERVEEYLRKHGHPRAVVRTLTPLGDATQEGLKSFGYGRPLRVTFTSQGEKHDVVVRTMSPDPFGHNRRADRIDGMVLSFDTFNRIPKHIRALEIGTFSEDGALVPMAPGEPFLLTSYVDGELYAHDLKALRDKSAAAPGDIARANALASYLVTLHAQRADPTIYVRAIRDTVAGGEGLFGQCDGYPDGHAIATPRRLEGIEAAAVRWRWRLRDKKHRARRTHGDFHPFNLLFRADEDFSVLDCSRGGVGEPADDVTCLAVNFIFFALSGRGHFKNGPERELWNVFWSTYLEKSGDKELLEVVAPFFAWRLLVLASPIWYPMLDDEVRDQLLRFAERLLEGARFRPDDIAELLA
jgi:hypothetical protein